VEGSLERKGHAIRKKSDDDGELEKRKTGLTSSLRERDHHAFDLVQLRSSVFFKTPQEWGRRPVLLKKGLGKRERSRKGGGRTSSWVEKVEKPAFGTRR